MNRFTIVFVVLLTEWGIALGGGVSAVPALIHPGGAANTALGQSGVSRAGSPASVFWNPANAGCLYEETNLNHVYTKYHEDLLPEELFSDRYHSFTLIASTVNDIFPHVDVGHAYFRNHIDLGKDTIVYSWESDTAILEYNETVTANAFAIRAFDIVSLGVTFKSWESRQGYRISEGYTSNDGIAAGKAIDLGIRINNRFNIFDIVYINPALGLSALNLGSDSAEYYTESENAHPLPRVLYFGASCEVNLLELLGYTFVYERGYDLPTEDEYTEHLGHRIQITPFYYLLYGKMTDEAGMRFEGSEGSTLEFNFQKTIRMVKRMLRFSDLLMGTNHYNEMAEWGNRLTIRGFEFKPNIHISRTKSEIYGLKPNQDRAGRKQRDWTIGIGIIGGFPSYQR